MESEGYSICFNEWALDKDIKNELGLLLIISSLCATRGYCFASNSYFAKLFDIDEVSVSRKLKILEDKKYITIEYKKQGYRVTERIIKVTKLSVNKNVNRSVNKIVNGTVNKNVKENNISINNINNNIREFKNNYVDYDLESLYMN